MAHIAHFVGSVAGVTAISIAIYLQLIAPRQCDWRYVAGFFVLGASVLLGNIQIFGASESITMSLMTIGYAVLTVFELSAAYWVYQRSNIRAPTTLVNEHVHK